MSDGDAGRDAHTLAAVRRISCEFALHAKARLEHDLCAMQCDAMRSCDLSRGLQEFELSMSMSMSMSMTPCPCPCM